jgi:excisionase family DNA binding protein
MRAQKKDKPTQQQTSERSAKAFFENSEAEYLSVVEVALVLSVSHRTVRGWIYKGELVPEHVGPRLIRFKKEYIKQWVSKQGGLNGNK